MFDGFIYFENSGLRVDPKKTEGFLIGYDSVMFYMSSGENITITNEEDIARFRKDVSKTEQPLPIRELCSVSMRLGELLGQGKVSGEEYNRLWVKRKQLLGRLGEKFPRIYLDSTPARESTENIVKSLRDDNETLLMRYEQDIALEARGTIAKESRKAEILRRMEE